MRLGAEETKVMIACTECGTLFPFPKVHWDAELAYVARVNAERKADAETRSKRTGKPESFREEKPKEFFCGPPHAMANPCFQAFRARATGYEGRSESMKRRRARERAEQAAT